MTGITGCAALGVSALFVDGFAKQASWLTVAAAAAGIATAAAFAVGNTPAVLRTLFSLVFSVAAAFGARAAWILLASVPLGERPSDIATGLIALLLFAASVLPALVVSGRFRFVRSLYGGEGAGIEASRYPDWASEMLSRRDFLTKPRWFGNLAGLLLFLLVVVSAAAVLKEPSGKWPLSLFLFVFLPGAAGIYLLLEQSTSILRWKMQGLSVPAETEATWNRVIRLFLVPVILVPLIIPWNFRIFDLSDAAEKFKQSLSGVTVDLIQNRDTTVTNAASTGIAQSNTVMSVKHETRRSASHVPKQVALFVLAAAAVWAVWRLVAGIAGAVLFAKYRYAKKSRTVQFFLKRYFQLRGVFEAILGFFAVILRLTLGAFGFGAARQKDNKVSPVEKQLFALFENRANASKEKKEEILTIVKQFVRIIETGSRRVLAWHHAMGPGEYGAKLSEKLPGVKGALAECVAVFNESRYSLHILSAERKASYVEAVERVLEEIEGYTQDLPKA